MGKILFVDDEKMILNFLKRGLKRHQFDAIFVDNGHAALELVKEGGIDVIFTDMKMPRMNGLELLKAVDEVDKDIVKVIVSGYAQLPQLIATINQTQVYKYIAKPFDLDTELIPIIHDTLDYANFKKNAKLKKTLLENKNETYKNILKNIETKADTKEESYGLIRIHNQIMLNSLRKLYLDDEIPINEVLNIIERLKRVSDDFIMEVKKNERHFEPKLLLQDIKSLIKSRGYKCHVEIGLDGICKFSYEGRNQHIKPILVAMVEDLIHRNELQVIKIVFTENFKAEDDVDDITDQFIYSYIIEFDNELDNLKDKISYNFMFYRSLIKAIGGNLTIRQVGVKTYVSLDYGVKQFLTRD